MTRIDFHTHVLPRDWPDLAERYGDPRWPRLEHQDACSARIMVGGEEFRRVTDRLYAVERRLADMEAHGIERQVLSTVPVMFSYWARPDRTREMARYLNEHIASVVAERPDRFDGLGTVPLNDPALAVAELERCVLELGLAGVEIGTNIAGVELDDPALEPFFGRAAELGAIVFVHPWQVIGADRLRRYHFLYTVAMPAETSFALGAMLFGGVLDRAPGLKVVFAHGGGSTPYIIGRMERGWNVSPAARERLAQPPSEVLLRCHFDSLTWDPPSLELLVRRVGAERVVLGSDYPFVMGEDRAGEVVDASALTDAQRQAVLGGTAARLLAAPA